VLGHRALARDTATILSRTSQQLLRSVRRLRGVERIPAIGVAHRTSSRPLLLMREPLRAERSLAIPSSDQIYSQ
jgi:hypothetical protein